MIAAKSKPTGWKRGPVLALVTLVAASAYLLGMQKDRAENTKPAPTTDEVRDQQAKYQEERAAADKSGVLAKFSPKMTERADHLAAKGMAALAGGRLFEAREAFHQAR